jgi:hypothetical protein
MHLLKNNNNNSIIKCWNLDLWGAAMLLEAAAYWWQPEAHGSMWMMVGLVLEGIVGSVTRS